MDRNSIIGFVLLLALGAGYIFWSNHEQKLYQEQKYADSMALAATRKPVTPQQQIAGTPADSLRAIDTTLPPAYRGAATLVNLSNGELNLQFSTKGGYPVQANFDSFKTSAGAPLAYFKGNGNKLSFNIPVNGKTVATDQLYFTPEITALPDGGKQLRMTATVAPGQNIVLDYALPRRGYMMTASLRLQGLQKDLGAIQSIPMSWNTEALHTEKDLKNERMNMQVHYRHMDGEHDYFTISRTGQKSMDKPLQWLSVRSHFFNSTIIADKGFKTGNFDGKEPADSNIVATNSSVFAIPVTASNDYAFDFKWYMGPNDYKVLKSYNVGLEEMIPLGFGLFFFVKYISKWMIIPLFDFLSQYISSFGLIIICLTLLIRLLLSFFTYKSYLSSAKMRVLKPELDELRAKYGDNQQQMGMEQMKLYRTAGVNPLGGCLPMLLQMPFLLAVYYFIPTAIQLRQSKFLWSNDLSTYDSVLNLGFNIPFYGDHVSLFTLLMTASSLFLAIYNKNMTAGAGGDMGNNAMLKYMPYIMPIMFLGWFNSMAAGLTFYYTFSNLISILQQFIIQKFFINEEAIHRKIQENRNKPAGTSKWQQRLEQMQKAQADKTKTKK
ncbi:membrane protein insertase YidC [Taibaiella chishuiensis]|uniref:membrane protein insertase YidC n=1 Tax=Taibaiella chishuiensis TaxID=1434707 RepID=UPI000D0D8A27|nr:membrane protein insertase YidC [Taibaiella chishuiensis]